MPDLAEMEQRLKRLEDIEAIKRLKYKYFRCLDTKQWDKLAECFVPDATTAFGDGKYRFQGVPAIIRFFQKGLGADPVSAIHHGHCPEIDISSDTTARGTWALYGHRIDRLEKTAYSHGAYYHDEYVKVEGQWKIKSTGYANILEESSAYSPP